MQQNTKSMQIKKSCRNIRFKRKSWKFLIQMLMVIKLFISVID